MIRLVNHCILSSRMESWFRISEIVLKWFESYLSDCRQFVNINGEKSATHDVNYWILNRYNLRYHLFADDTQIYISFKTSDIASSKQRAEECVAEICYWININELEFNHDKTDILLIHLRCHHKPPVDQWV